ncbi:MAG: ATP-binding protein [Candidatus Methylomirabilales bacterium]
MPFDRMPQENRDFDAIFGPVLEQLVGLLEAEAGVLWIWDETTAAFVPALCRGRGSWAAPWSPSHPEGIGREDLDPCRETLLLDDLPPDCPLPAGEQKIRSFASVPLGRGGTETGFLALYSRRRGHFAPRDLRFLQMLGQVMGRTIGQLDSTAGPQVRPALDSPDEQEESRQLRDLNTTLIDATDVGILVLDAEGRWAFGNRQIYEMLGYAPWEGPGRLGRPEPQPPPGFRASDLSRLNRRDRAGIFETRMFRKDGSTFSALVSSTPRRGPSGEFLGTIVLVTDITERKQWDQQVMRSEKLAALGTLAAGVAHNINNVLAAIVARTDLLLRQAQDNELKRWLNSIQQSALDGASTVRRLQDFARTGAPESMASVDINCVITEVLQFTQARWKDEAELRGARIEVVRALSEIPLITGNAAELREVFTNVILNALDAMPNGGCLNVSTRFEPGRDEGPWVEAIFEDSGVGMTEEVRQKIFDPFFTTKGVKGTGLGLSTSYGIVARHGGSITVESEPGQGSRFCVGFPVPAELPGSPEALSTQAGRRTGRILVIDDEPHLREVVTNLLRLEGHMAVGVGSGFEGVEVFRAEPFDVVVTDLGMPDLTGLEVTRKIRGLYPEVKVILCTGWNATVSQAEQETSGIDRLLEKPFRLDRLLHLVHDLLRAAPEPESRRR